MAKKEEALITKHRSTLWAHFANIFLGFWLIFSQIAFGYESGFYSLNDQICGLIVVIFGLCSLSHRLIFAPWVVCFTGIWLSFAPLLFSTPQAAVYANETIIGALLITFSLLIPGLPGVIEEKGKNIPPGWSYNPSSWIQRIPVIALACVGWMISRYLAAYQLGYIDTIWDPVFADGTKDVITSALSRSFPISDAGFGAFAYTLEALMGCKGGENRWRTMPWMVVAFAFLVVPLGVVSILLVISQPLLVHHWCFLCLVTAVCMLTMVTLTVDEMFATLHFLYKATQEGKGFWKTFFLGGECHGIQEDLRTPPFGSSWFRLIATWRWGITIVWNLIVAKWIGIWLMFTPFLFGLEGAVADGDHLIGALVIVISTIALAEVARPLRWLLPLTGVAIALLPLFAPGLSLLALCNQVAAGLAVILLAFRKGQIKELYGEWN